MGQPTAQRNHLFDNLKGFAILLVVFGHFIQPCIKDSDWMKSIFFSIYTLHMPLFCLVSGYLYKFGRSSAWQRIKRYLLYLIAGQAAYTTICWAFQADLIYYSLLWYLVAMCFWVLITPLLTRRGIWLPLAAALLGGLLIGLLPTEGFTIVSPRILTYYPYFLIGVLLYEKRDTLSSVQFTPQRRIFAYAGMLIVLGLLLSQLETINYRAVFLNQDYLDMDVSYTLGIATRLSLYVLGIVAAMSVFFLFPKKATLFSGLGRASALIYLIHGLVIKACVLLFTDVMTTPYSNLMVSLGVMTALLLYGYRRFSIEKIIH